MVIPALRIGASLVGMLVAGGLLFEAIRLQRVALGGIVAEKLSYVYLAITCLAASAIAQWARNFVDGLTLEQVRFASELLVIVAMALLALYFSSVRTGMRNYLQAATSQAQELSQTTPAE